MSTDILIPPADVRYRIVNREHSADQYRKIGADSVASLLEHLDRHSDMRNAGAKILDFGCGCARTAQPLKAALPNWDIFGTDIDEVTVNWSSENVSADRFSVNAAEPPLSYDAESFDLVYALSVFSHLDAGMQFRWLAELVRVLKPGGYLYLTFTGLKVLEHSKEAFPADVIFEFEKTGFAYFSNIGDGVLPAWYQTSLQTGDYVTSSMPACVKLLEHEIGGHAGWQDAALYQKLA